MSKNDVLIASAISKAGQLILKQAEFTCIHDRPGTSYFRYCSECPLSAIGDHDYFEYDESRIMCTKPREYPK